MCFSKRGLGSSSAAENKMLEVTPVVLSPNIWDLLSYINLGFPPYRQQVW